MKKTFTLLLALAFLPLIMSAQPEDQTFSDPGTFTYTIPSGFTATISVAVWGGGGGSNGGSNAGRAGGGGGGFAVKEYVDLPAGDYTVIVGVGGSASAAAGGESSSFAGPTIVSATGGNRAQGATQGTGGTGVGGDVNFTGGTGGARQTNVAGGGGGGAAGANGNGGNGGDASGGTPGAGGIAGIGGGNGGDGQPNGGGAANDGAAPGGGAGGLGHNGSATGGAGGNGRVIITVISSLPVELISFKAKAETDAVTLTWQTASELNNDYFAVERSVDGRNFSEVIKVRGEGTSAIINDYRAVDNNPFTGVNYYRLRQVDFDGTQDFSDVIQVTFRSDKQAGALNVYPTLLQNTSTLYVDLSENNKGITTFDVFDFNGKLVSSVQLNGGDLASFSIDELQNGMYLIKSRGLENSEAARFIIAR